MPGFLKRFGLFAGGSALGALVDYLATLALTQLFGISPAFALGLAMLLSATGVFFWHEHVTFGVAGRLGQGRRYLVFMVWSGAVFLLRAIAGLDPQDRGIIEQNGEDISTRPVTRRDFGIVFQSYALFPNLTVRRNVGYGLHHSGLSRRGRRDRIAELLEMVGLADQGRKYPAQLSGGQQQRVALARALAPSPGLLLLDEPLSALDARVRLHLRRELRDLQQKLGVTTIMVTHDQDEALATADRIVVMRRGRIEQTGRPEDVFSNPATPFVASFFGAMNFISANVSADGTITAGEGSFTVPQHEFPAGAEVSLCIRPSDIVTGPPAQAAQNRLRGKIVSALFRGTFHHVVLDCPVLGQTLEAEISSDHWGRHELTPGTEAMIALPQDKLHLFARGAET